MTTPDPEVRAAAEAVGFAHLAHLDAEAAVMSAARDDATKSGDLAATRWRAGSARGFYEEAVRAYRAAVAVQRNREAAEWKVRWDAERAELAAAQQAEKAARLAERDALIASIPVLGPDHLSREDQDLLEQMNRNLDDRKRTGTGN